MEGFDLSNIMVAAVQTNLIRASKYSWYEADLIKSGTSLELEKPQNEGSKER